jgi:hypothetical protein
VTVEWVGVVADRRPLGRCRSGGGRYQQYVLRVPLSMPVTALKRTWSKGENRYRPRTSLAAPSIHALDCRYWLLLASCPPIQPGSYILLIVL